MLKTADRYIINQVKSAVLFSFFIFASLWIVQLLIRILDLIISKGTSLEAVTKILIYSLPMIIVTSTPMAVLMGVMLGLSRLNNDSEIIAFKAAGISTIRLLFPLLCGGLCISLFVMFVNEKLAPISKFLSQEVYINEITLKKPLPKIAQNIFFDGGEHFKLYVRDYNAKDEIMNNVTLFQFGKDFPQVTESRRARLEDGSLWIFEQGRTSSFSTEGFLEYFIQFEKWIYPISERYTQQIQRNRENRSPDEMNMKELKSHIDQRKAQKLDAREFESQFYWRSSFPFASFFLILVGAPLSMRMVRGGKASGFGMGIFVMLVYYVFLSLGRSLGGNGTMHPLPANWLPNIICTVSGLYFIIRSRL
jgi:lipopolysaccharide export system permease protein